MKSKAPREREEGWTMDIEKFLERTKSLEKKKQGKKEEMERVKKFFERFHLLNRAFLDKETFEKAQDSISSMAEAIGNTIQYLDSEIARLRSKRMKMPFENVTLGEMQKVQNKNEMLVRDFLEGFRKKGKG
jgi:phosphopantetheinyl transferase (holo-ACP synthase)